MKHKYHYAIKRMKINHSISYRYLSKLRIIADIIRLKNRIELKMKQILFCFIFKKELMRLVDFNNFAHFIIIDSIIIMIRI